MTNKFIGKENGKYIIGKKVRKVIEDMGGIMPENLPIPDKSLKELEKETKNNR